MCNHNSKATQLLFLRMNIQTFKRPTSETNNLNACDTTVDMRIARGQCIHGRLEVCMFLGCKLTDRSLPLPPPPPQGRLDALASWYDFELFDGPEHPRFLQIFYAHIVKKYYIFPSPEQISVFLQK